MGAGPRRARTLAPTSRCTSVSLLERSGPEKERRSVNFRELLATPLDRVAFDCGSLALIAGCQFTDGDEATPFADVRAPRVQTRAVRARQGRTRGRTHGPRAEARAR